LNNLERRETFTINPFEPTTRIFATIDPGHYAWQDGADRGYLSSKVSNIEQDLWAQVEIFYQEIANEDPVSLSLSFKVDELVKRS